MLSKGLFNAYQNSYSKRNKRIDENDIILQQYSDILKLDDIEKHFLLD